MKPFQVRERKKTAAVPSGGAFPPEERVSAGQGGSEQGPTTDARQRAEAVKPELQKKRDSVGDEMPGENPDENEGQFNGQGDYAQRGEKQPILDYTPCKWGAQQLQELAESGAAEEQIPQMAIAQTAEGDILVSLEVCRQCEFEQGCYGLTDEHEENRLAKKQASGITPEMPEILVAEKIARLRMKEDDARMFLVKRGFSAPAAMGIMRLVSGL